jgi:hypothetical protein
MNRISILIISLAASFTLLHGGRTDADGGHYVGGSDEYHYHHGYPAHDHYDIDGDGIADCPYNFDDQTDHKNGVQSTKKPDKATETETDYVNKQNDLTISEPKEKTTNKRALRNIGNMIIILILAVIVPLSLFVYIPEFIRKITDYFHKRR